MISIREVHISDAPRLADMYSYYVENTAVSFEYEAPTADEFVMRIKRTTEKYPYLVCVDDGKVVGYAYAGAYSTRQAYDWTATSSIYVDKEYRRKGIGTLLYNELQHTAEGHTHLHKRSNLDSSRRYSSHQGRGWRRHDPPPV